MSAALIQTASKSQRSRSTNFSVFETECLVEEVIKRADVIENKQTDAVTWKMKELSWNQVTEAFNAITAGTRNVKNLKSKYECIKGSIKKKYNAGRAEQIKTGGGAATKILYTPWEEKIMQLIFLSVEGLPGRNDCDTVKPTAPEKNCILQTVEIIDHDKAKPQENNVAIISGDELDSGVLHVDINTNGASLMEVENHPTISQNFSKTKNRLWDSWSPTTLRTPKSSKLKTANRTANKSTTNLKNIVTSREELIDLQKKVAEQELLKLSIEIENLRNVDKQAKIEHDLRVDILKKQKEEYN